MMRVRRFGFWQRPKRARRRCQLCGRSVSVDGLGRLTMHGEPLDRCPGGIPGKPTIAIETAGEACSPARPSLPFHAKLVADVQWAARRALAVRPQRIRIARQRAGFKI
jgi:hypothetical protein